MKQLKFNLPIEINLERINVENSIWDKDDIETLNKIKNGEILEYNVEAKLMNDTYTGKGLWLTPDFKNIHQEILILNASSGISGLIGDMLLDAKKKGQIWKAEIYFLKLEN